MVRLNTVTGLRFVACLCVLLSHSSVYLNQRTDQSFFSFTKLGDFGVAIFFVISGIVVPMSINFDLPTKENLIGFSVNRFARIYPLYGIVTLIKLLIFFMSSGLILHAAPSFVNLVCSFLLVPSLSIEGEYGTFLGVGWTLIYELFFYILLGFSIFFKDYRFKLPSFIILTLVCLGLYNTNHHNPFLFYCNPLILYFIAGIVCLKAIRKKEDVTFFASMIFLFVLNSYSVYRLRTDNSIFTWKESIFIFPLAIVIVYCAVRLELSGKLNVPKSLLFVGDASYSIYLLHTLLVPFALIFLLKIGIHSEFILFLGEVIFGIFFGCLFHAYIEIPLLRYIRSGLKKLFKISN